MFSSPKLLAKSAKLTNNKFQPLLQGFTQDFLLIFLRWAFVFFLFLYSFSISNPFLLELNITVDNICFAALTCKCVICVICWSLPMMVFFGRSVWVELLVAGILRRWIVTDLTEVSADSNPSRSSISYISKSVNFLLILPTLTSHWILTNVWYICGVEHAVNWKFIIFCWLVYEFK